MLNLTIEEIFSKKQPVQLNKKEEQRKIAEEKKEGRIKRAFKEVSDLVKIECEKTGISELDCWSKVKESIIAREDDIGTLTRETEKIKLLELINGKIDEIARIDKEEKDKI